MVYKFEVEDKNYSDLSSGKVLLNFQNSPAFPIRLASEIFQRCLAIRSTQGVSGRCSLYDPCCGGGYLLTTLALTHWDNLTQVIGSDVDAEALKLAEQNLALLTAEGLENRISRLEAMLAQYNKLSHSEALASAKRLKQQLLERLKTHQATSQLFLADATDGKSIAEKLTSQKVDIVITDVPYGRQSSWQQNRNNAPIQQMLQSLLPVLTTDSVVAICTDKTQKAAHERYQRVEQFQVGKRRVFLLQPIGLG